MVKIFRMVITEFAVYYLMMFLIKICILCMLKNVEIISGFRILTDFSSFNAILTFVKMIQNNRQQLLNIAMISREYLRRMIVQTSVFMCYWFRFQRKQGLVVYRCRSVPLSGSTTDKTNFYRQLTKNITEPSNKVIY